MFRLLSRIALRYLLDNRGFAATSVEYASGDTNLETLVLHTLPSFGPHGDGIINNNFLFSLLKMKNRFKVLEGGLEFWSGIRTVKSSNSQWQGKTDDMTAQLQNPRKRLRWDIKTFTHSVVINKLDEAKNKGRAMMKNFAQSERDDAKTDVPNAFNSAFWTLVPGALEPESIPSLVSITPAAGTIGGLNRAGEQSLQNGAYTDAVADIGSEAGIAALKLQQVRRAIGSGGKDIADVMIMDESNFAGLVGYLASQNRFRPDDRFADLDMDTIKLGKTTMSYENTTVSGGENTITAGYVYGLNSNHLKFEVLKDGNFKWNPEGFVQVSQTLNRALYFWVFCNLTTNLPKAHFVMTNVSST